MIGAGLLGTALAERLLAAGYTVLGFDIDSGRLDHLEAVGGQRAGSAREVAADCQRLLFSLPDSAVVQTVVTQVSDSITAGSTICDTTTGSPEVSTSIAGLLAQRQIDYLDATVAGSSQQARAGEAVMMIGGSQAAARRCEDLFTALAASTFYVGPSGSGARMKLVVNLVLGLNRAVLAEGLSLARACGVDPAVALQILRSGAAYSACMDSKGTKMVQSEFTPQARLAQHRKDVELITALGEQHALELPLSRVHALLLDRAIQLGFGESDNSAVIKAFG